MQDNAVTSARRLLPRWRTLARTPAYEVPVYRASSWTHRRAVL